MAVPAPPDPKPTPPAAVTPRALRKPSPSTTPTTSLPEAADAVVVELAEHRARRWLAVKGLLPTVPTPCGPCCTCWGQPAGYGCGS
jgi:hypothetical protein